MNNGQTALKTAIDLMHMPSRAVLVRTAPLPADVSLLLRIAVGDEQAIRTATTASKCPPEAVRQAAVFFIEQVLLSQDADSYRVLGTKPEASGQELRTNMALLIRWLHPDHDPDGTRTIFISRVTGAWDTLKTGERRTAYDRMLQQQQKASSRPPGSRQKQPRKKTRPRNHRQGQSPQDPSSRTRGRKKLGLFRQLLLLVFNRTIR